MHYHQLHYVVFAVLTINPQVGQWVGYGRDIVLPNRWVSKLNNEYYNAKCTE